MSSETAPLLDAPIRLKSSEAQLVQSVLRQWRNRELLAPATCAQLLETLEIQDLFDWPRLAKYTFRLSLACLIIAVVSLIFDGAFLKLIRKVREVDAYTRAATTTAASVGIHYYAYRHSRQAPAEVWSNEAIHAVGAIVLSLAALQLAEAVQGLKMHNGGVIDFRGRRVMWLLAFCYALIGIATGSTFIWSCGMATMGIWTAYWVPQRGTMDFFRRDYPVRFVILGSTLLSIGCCMSKCVYPLRSTTRIWGLTYLFFFGLLYGNFINTLDMRRPYSRLWPALSWTLALTIAASTSIWHGLRYDDATTRGFGVVFLALDIYTRYWNLFWRRVYTPVFFAMLAGSLALAGWGAEKIWRVKAEGARR